MADAGGDLWLAFWDGQESRRTGARSGTLGGIIAAVKAGIPVVIHPKGWTGRAVVQELTPMEVSTVVVPMTESGDSGSICSNCACEVSEPHTWRQCATELSTRHRHILDHALELEHELNRMRSKLRECQDEIGCLCEPWL
jgi:hypothetical protein